MDGSGTRRDEPYAIPAVVVLVQTINHATEHRAHVMTCLTQAGVAPSEFVEPLQTGLLLYYKLRAHL